MMTHQQLRQRIKDEIINLKWEEISNLKWEESLESATNLPSFSVLPDYIMLPTHQHNRSNNQDKNES